MRFSSLGLALLLSLVGAVWFATDALLRGSQASRAEAVNIGDEFGATEDDSSQGELLRPLGRSVTREPVETLATESRPPAEERAPSIRSPRSVVTGLRVEGRTFVDARPTAGLDVRVGVSFGGEFLPVGRATSGADGRYVVSLASLAEELSIASRRCDVRARTTSQGFAPSEAWLSPSDRVGDVLLMDLHTRDLGRIVRGRVVDRSGAGVPLADVHLEGTGDLAVQRTDSDGAFSAPLRREEGEISVLASHRAHGRGQLSASYDGAPEVLDLGDVVLTPRGILAGRIVGADGIGIPHLEARVRESSAPGSAHFTFATEEGGAFRLADLEPGCEYELTWVHRSRVLRPDASDLVLRADVASARVHVLSEDRRPLRGVDPEVRAIETDAHTSSARATDRAGISTFDNLDGSHDMLFEQPGTYVVFASYDSDGRTWRAEESLSVVHERHAVELILREVPTVEVELTVLDPDGRPVDRWSASAHTRTGDVEVASTSAGSPVRLPPGDYRVRVVPHASSSCAPFETWISVRAGSPATPVLHAPAWGGTLSAKIQSPGSESEFGIVRAIPARSPNGTSVAGPFAVSIGVEKSAWRALPPGRYDVHAVVGARLTDTRTVVIEPRATTRVVLTLDPK